MNISDELIKVNYWQGRAGHPVEAVCFHVAEGGRSGVTSWFNNPFSEASAHYLVCKDGAIVRYVAEGDTAWANGKVNRPNMADPLIASWVRAGINPNRRTIAIETEGRYTEDLTPAQLAACCELAADIHQRYRLPVDGSRIIGHNEIDDVTRHNCPSFSAAEWAAILAAVARGGYADDGGEHDNPGARLHAAYRALPAYLRGSEIGSEFYEFRADFSATPGAPVPAGHGLRSEYLIQWTAPGQPIRAMQPELFAGLLSSGRITIFQ